MTTYYYITFYTLYLDQVIDVWQSEFGKELNHYENERITRWSFGSDEKLYMDTLKWIDHLEASGFVRHVKRMEENDHPF